MTVRVHRSERSRHLVIRLTEGELLPAALAGRLADERVACGWLRASGVLADVELQAFDPKAGGLGSPRRIAGPLQVLALESSIGRTEGAPGFSLRAVLAREGDSGLETLAGEVVAARALGLEVIVTVLDDLALERTLDASAGVTLLDPGASAIAVRAPASLPQARPQGGGQTWTTAVEVSAQTDRDRDTIASRPAGTMPIPQRPARPEVDFDAPVPEPGDVVDHFAFGRCDVLKSDGDRLHLRVHKDGRIREIALEMLRVTRLDDEQGGVSENGHRRFKLERRL